MEKNLTQSPDTVSILLGANDLQYDASVGIEIKVNCFCLEIEKFVDSMREYSPTLPIILNLPDLCAP